MRGAPPPGRLVSRRTLLAVLLLGVVPSAPARGADAPKAEPPPAVAKFTSTDNGLIRRAAGSSEWSRVKPGSEVQAGALLIAVPTATLDSADGAVRLSMLADLAKTSPFPVYESAVVLHATKGYDLDVTLDRGRIDLTNRKDKGAAKVRVRFGHAPAADKASPRRYAWDITLTEPGSRVALELYGRWPRGTTFSEKPAPGERPTTDMVALVLKGQVRIATETAEFLLREPPGPAYFHWDSVAGADAAPQRLEKLPAWAEPEKEETPAVREIKAALAKIRGRLGTKSPAEVVAELSRAESPAERRAGVIYAGAIDALPHLIDALNSPKFPEVRETAVSALRHWIGRAPGQDQKLFQALVEKKFPKGQAATVMQLLHSFGTADLARADTYEILVDYLTSDKVAVRELAHWHLTRLVPEGKAIVYDAGAPAEDRKQSAARWRKVLTEAKIVPKR